MHQSRALVVHHDPHKRELFRALFRTQGFEAFMAQEGRQALNLALESLPHVVLIAEDLGDVGGEEICDRLSQQRERYGIELIILLQEEPAETSISDEVLIVKDSLDFRPIRRIISEYRKVRVLNELAADDSTRVPDLERFLANLRDPLTGVCHHEYLRIRLEEEQKRSQRYGLDLSLLTIETRNFKAIREEQGHLAANDVLLWLSGILLMETRDVDLVARVPDSRFEVLLPNTSRSGAEVLARRLKPKLQSSPPDWNEKLGPVVTLDVESLVAPD